VLRFLTIAAALLVSGALYASTAQAAQPVEGYRTADGRIGCVMYQGFNSAGNAVKCGRRGSSRGLLLASDGSARSAAWRWPARSLGSLFFRTTPGQTLYLYGGTAKVEGDDSNLRCSFTRASVRCLNGGGAGLTVTATGARRIQP
jgi:hypothetical protein